VAAGRDAEVHDEERGSQERGSRERGAAARLAAGLVARTTALADLPNLLEAAGAGGLLWRDEHGGLVGDGVALRLSLPGGLADAEAVRSVGETLRALTVEDAVGLPGCGPVAIGALPFDPTAPATLVVPRRIIGRRDGRAWVTTIGPANKLPAGAAVDTGAADGVGARAGDPPDEFTLTPSLSHAEWKAMVASAVERIQSGDFRKVVLARRIDIAANRPFIVADVLARLEALYPSCMIFSIDGFIGASPELLIGRRGDRVSSHPLAGTVARSGDAHSDEVLVAGLMASPKARREHQVVVDVLRAALAPACTELEVPDAPSVLGLRNVSHLATNISGRLRPPAYETALELVARVHPTPAVGGTPTPAALDYLQKVEGFDRHTYAGPVGWVDARGDGAWAVGIRCAEVDGARARIFAGNGVVAGSDPDDELAETQLKLQALLAALVRP
jgi:menaquinone-specific isochorismate synthase